MSTFWILVFLAGIVWWVFKHPTHGPKADFHYKRGVARIRNGIDAVMEDPGYPDENLENSDESDR